MADAVNKKDTILNVTIISPEETLFEGTATALTCINKEGEFDILPFHSNFISLIYKRIVIHLITNESKTLDIGYALLKSFGDKITILTNVDISSYSEILTATHSPENKPTK